MLFGCLTALLFLANIAAWIVWTVISFRAGAGPGFAAAIGTVSYLLSWGIVDGSIMSPVTYFFNPALSIWTMKAGFCNAVGLALWGISGYFLY